MSLINCRNCGKQISDKAQRCIHCGCPIEKMILVVKKEHNLNIKWRLIRIIFLICIIIYICIILF